MKSVIKVYSGFIVVQLNAAAIVPSVIMVIFVRINEQI